MIRLKKIRRENDSFVCEAYVEDCSIPVHVIYDIKTRSIPEYALPEEYHYCKEHISMARRYFDFVLSGKEKLKQEKLIMWY